MTQRKAVWEDCLPGAATFLYREQSFLSISMQDLPAALGLQKGSLNHHIDIREQVLDRMLRETRCHLAAQMDATTAGAPLPCGKLHVNET